MWWTVAGAVVGSTALVVAAPIALPALGFGAGGVAAGSAAAAVHGMIGNVVAGSVFAIPYRAPERQAWLERHMLV